MDSRNPGRVLIVDDDFLVCEVTRATLEELGYAVLDVASNGEEAIEMTRTLKPDVVLMDVHLPGMDGIEAAHRICHCCPTPVVVLSAYDTPDLIDRATAAGIGAFVTKPPDVSDLDHAIRIAIARFHDMEELRRLNSTLQQEVAERRRAEAQIAAVSRLYAVLSEVNEAIVRSPEQGRLFEEVCRIAVERGGFRMAWVGLVEEETGRISPAAHSGAPEGYLPRLNLRRGIGLTGMATQEGVPLVANRRTEDPRVLNRDEEARELGFLSSGAFPLRRGGQVIGTLNLYSNQYDFFTDQVTALLEQVAADVCFALDKEQMEAQHLKAEAAVRESEARYRSLLDSIADSVYIKDLEGRFVFANGEFARQRSLSPEQVLGKTIRDLFPEAVIPISEEEDRQVISRDVVLCVERWVDNALGHRLVEIHKGPLRDADGTIIGIVAIGRDVTDRRRVEEEDSLSR